MENDFSIKSVIFKMYSTVQFNKKQNISLNLRKIIFYIISILSQGWIYWRCYNHQRTDSHDVYSFRYMNKTCLVCMFSCPTVPGLLCFSPSYCLPSCPSLYHGPLVFEKARHPKNTRIFAVV